MICIIRHIRKTVIRKILLAATAATIMLPVNSCGGKSEEERLNEAISAARYRYDHIDKIIDQYCRLLISTPPEGMQMEELLMDINSRCQLLMAEGDTLTALYFHHAIENNMRLRDSILADRIFGIRPYTAFNIR